jgi:hypothetical protein
MKERYKDKNKICKAGQITIGKCEIIKKSDLRRLKEELGMNKIIQ